MEIMIRLFERTLINSMEAAAVVIAILLLSWLFRKKLSPGWHYALWMLLLVKLLLPLLPGNLESQLRWISLPDSIEASVHDDGNGIRNSDPVAVPAGVTDIPSNSATGSTDGGTVTEPSAAAWQLSDDVIRISAIVWLSGVALIWLLLSVGHLRTSLAFRKEARIPIPRELDELFTKIRASSGIHSRVGLRLTRLVSAPALFGIRSPVVLIPREVLGHLTEAEWECVIRHELAHCQRRDIPINLLAYLLASVHWFNPAVWFGLQRMRIDQENACDATVLSSSELKEPYAASIVKLLEIGASQKTVTAGVGFFGNKKQIKRRIVMIRDYQPSKKKISLIGLSLLLAAAVLTLPSAFADSKPAPSEQIEEAAQPLAEIIPAAKTSDESAIEFSLQLPKGSKISSPFGYRIHPVSAKKSLHDGIDIAGKKGTDIVAAAGGKVVLAESVSAKGLTVTIEHNKVWSTEYRHLDKLSVKEGDEVKEGDLIGLMGSTGNSTGPHLHFSVLKNGEYVDPNPVTTIRVNEK
ncbi:M23/M56 family metallopeptidase [Cohnella herbarum]|uniref:Peptidoglycan DD-metalloendopeptidase family protein n=1 Tax=Cohnella herbarum TaxID=2728023 RepID=A0A7Z2VPY8_9BACL|nr:M23/M56 family metallopeptidase [Cohnella herbarum]QJD86984.1 peptidoglycan DD-metalloendopeptidase family protein [Cohnella herbarum]